MSMAGNIVLSCFNPDFPVFLSIGFCWTSMISRGFHYFVLPKIILWDCSCSWKRTIYKIGQSSHSTQMLQNWPNTKEKKHRDLSVNRGFTTAAFVTSRQKKATKLNVNRWCPNKLVIPRNFPTRRLLAHPHAREAENLDLSEKEILLGHWLHGASADKKTISWCSSLSSTKVFPVECAIGLNFHYSRAFKAISMMTDDPISSFLCVIPVGIISIV